MNQTQKSILSAGLLLACLLVAFPPHNFTDSFEIGYASAIGIQPDSDIVFRPLWSKGTVRIGDEIGSLEINNPLWIVLMMAVGFASIGGAMFMADKSRPSSGT